MTMEVPKHEDIKEFLSGAVLQQKIKQLGTQISQDYQGEEVVLIGLMHGCIFFFADLVRQISLKAELDFIYAKSYHGTKSTGNVNILLDSKIDIFQRHVLVIDDIIDTGITLNTIRSMLTTRQPKSLEFCVLFDKKERREVEVAVKYVGFVVPDRFFIGFGLDLDGLFRELPFLGTVDSL